MCAVTQIRVYLFLSKFKNPWKQTASTDAFRCLDYAKTMDWIIISVLWQLYMVDYFNKNFADYKVGFASQGRQFYIWIIERWICELRHKSIWINFPPVKSFSNSLREHLLTIQPASRQGAETVWRKHIEILQLYFSTGESWLGLEKLHLLTNQRSYKLHIHLTTFGGQSYLAVFEQFQVCFTRFHSKTKIQSLLNWCR